MITVNIHEATAHFSRLVDAATAGEEILICKAGKPVARLSALKAPTPERKRGLLEGAFRVPDDFDAPLPEDVLTEFEKP